MMRIYHGLRFRAIAYARTISPLLPRQLMLMLLSRRINGARQQRVQCPVYTLRFAHAALITLFCRLAMP